MQIQHCGCRVSALNYSSVAFVYCWKLECFLVLARCLSQTHQSSFWRDTFFIDLRQKANMLLLCRAVGGSGVGTCNTDYAQSKSFLNVVNVQSC